MGLRDASFDVCTSRGAFDPRNGLPVHSSYRYSGPLGPAYVGWTDDDQMTWVEGVNLGSANLEWGVGIPLSSMTERKALQKGVLLRISDEVMKVSGPDREGVRLSLRGGKGRWTLEGTRSGVFNRRLRPYNRRLWRESPSHGPLLLALLCNGTGKSSLRVMVEEEISPKEVTLLIFCWASLRHNLIEGFRSP
jgi:hypothetical protein